MANLRGQLQSISLTDVLQMLHMNRKTGELLVRRGEQSGVMYLQNGEVIHAVSGKTQGGSAAFDILEWETGEFEFVAIASKGYTTIKRSLPDLLMEAAKTTDTRRHLADSFPDLNAAPWPGMPEPRLSADLAIPAEDRGCLALLDGYRTFTEIIAESGQTQVSVLQVCATLLAAKRLTLLQATATLATLAVKPGLTQKSDLVRLAKSHETRWLAMGPYKAKPINNVKIAGGQYTLNLPGGGYGVMPIERVRVVWASGSAVLPVLFGKTVTDETIGIPPKLLQAWGLPEGTPVDVRPAP